MLFAAASLVSLVLPFRPAVVGCVAVILLSPPAGPRTRAAAPRQRPFDSALALEQFVGRVRARGADHRVVRRQVVVRSGTSCCTGGAQAATAGTLLRLGSVATGAAHELAGRCRRRGHRREMRRNARTADDKRDAKSSPAGRCLSPDRDFRNAAGHATGEAGAVPLDEFLHGALSTVKATRPNASIRSQFHGERPVPTIGVNPSLKQTILILLNNAADASPRDAPGRAGMRRSDGGSQRSRQQLRGIQPGEAGPHSSPQVAGQGMGLGLVLAASAVARLGSTIRWTKRAEGGACRTRLPITQLTTNPGVMEDNELDVQDIPSLLLVDDDKVLCDVLARALGARGYGVCVAHSYEEALRAVDLEPPEFAVVDL
jgi:CheY-like chemotaxis protein